MRLLRRWKYAVLCDAASAISHALDQAGFWAGPAGSRMAGWCHEASLTAGRV